MLERPKEPYYKGFGGGLDASVSRVLRGGVRVYCSKKNGRYAQSSRKEMAGAYGAIQRDLSAEFRQVDTFRSDGEILAEMKEACKKVGKLHDVMVVLRRPRLITPKNRLAMKSAIAAGGIAAAAVGIGVFADSTSHSGTAVSAGGCYQVSIADEVSNSGVKVLTPPNCGQLYKPNTLVYFSDNGNSAISGSPYGLYTGEWVGQYYFKLSGPRTEVIRVPAAHASLLASPEFWVVIAIASISVLYHIFNDGTSAGGGQGGGGGYRSSSSGSGSYAPATSGRSVPASTGDDGGYGQAYPPGQRGMGL